MMYRILFLLSLGVLLPTCWATAQQDSVYTNLSERSARRLSPTLGLQEKTMSNPALRFYVWDFSHTQMDVNSSSQEEDETLVQQLGNGRKGYGLDISTLLASSPNTRAWGRAHYDNVDRSGIRMNLSSDYDRVYPYITADTMAPADLKGETYLLSGGYARQMGRYLMGISASTRNMQEHRQLDPRPRNRVSDVDVTLGGGLVLPVPYALGLSVGFASYKQAHTVTSLSDHRRRTGSPLFSMTGLGTALGNISESGFTYQARTWTSGVDLYPTRGRGWTAHLSYAFDHLDKTLGSSGGALTGINGNRNSSPINDVLNMQEDRWHARLGWIGHGDRHNWTVQGSYTSRHRIGSEILIASSIQDIGGITTNHTNMGMVPYYQENITQWRLDAIYERGMTKRWYVKPHVDYRENSTDYYDPARYLKYSRMDYGAQIGLFWIQRDHLLHLSLGGGYDQCFSADIDISNTLEAISPNIEMLYGHLNRHAPGVELANYRFLANDNSYINASARWEWQLFSNKSLFLQPIYQQGWYTDNVQSSYWQVRVGMVL